MIAFAEQQETVNENEEDESWDNLIEIKNLLFDQEWDDIVDVFVKNRVVDIFPDRDIKFTMAVNSARHVQRKIAERWYEIDLVLFNSNSTIAIDVQPTLDKSEVNRFLCKLEIFRKEGFPSFLKNEKIVGAVAYIRGKPEAVQYAQDRGLFAILATGKSAKIVNADDFEPQKWGT